MHSHRRHKVASSNTLAYTWCCCPIYNLLCITSRCCEWIHPPCASGWWGCRLQWWRWPFCVWSFFISISSELNFNTFLVRLRLKSRKVVKGASNKIQRQFRTTSTDTSSSLHVVICWKYCAENSNKVKSLVTCNNMACIVVCLRRVQCKLLFRFSWTCLFSLRASCCNIWHLRLNFSDRYSTIPPKNPQFLFLRQPISVRDLILPH